MKEPDNSQRAVICGRTGSGKTHEGLHQLSDRSFDVMPWICLDFKANDLLARLPVTGLATMDEPPPREPGLYVVRTIWADSKPGGRLDRYLDQVLTQGNTGLFIDEGQQIISQPPNHGLRMVLT